MHIKKCKKKNNMANMRDYFALKNKMHQILVFQDNTIKNIFGKILLQTITGMMLFQIFRKFMASGSENSD